MKDKQLAEALTAYFEGRENEAEKALESMSRTSENPVVFQALYWMNALKNYPKSEIFLKKMQSLYDKDKEAFNQAFAEVKTLLEFYAEKQAPLAQTFLGDMYYFGRGVNFGRGVKQDYTEAAKWYLKAAEQGFAPAQLFLGNMYYFGYIVKQDNAEAVKWYSKAAEQGHARAQFWLGHMYYFGAGVKEDKAKAAKWWSKAAEQGHADAQSWLGMMYEYGEGVKQDYKTAYMWYFLANLILANLNGSNYTDENARNLEKKEGWFSSAKLSPSEAREVKAEATRKYYEIRKRYGLD